MTKFFTTLMLVVSLITLPGCWSSEHQQGCCSCDSHVPHQALTIKEAKPGLIVVNVLDEEHFNDCHIPGSMNVSFDHIEDLSAELESKFGAQKDTLEIVLYCSNYMCSASGEAANMLVKKGFKNVYAYEAGMADWFQEQLPVVGPHQKNYLKKKMAAPPVQEQHSYGILTTQELAQKLGIALNNALTHDSEPQSSELVK